MKEADIRPHDIFAEYLRLSAADAQEMLKQDKQFCDVACPACDSRQRESFCEKNGFHIQRCTDCGSIYCSPRPSIEQLGQFYMNSPSSRFWAEEFFPAVVDARREKLFKPKARQMRDVLQGEEFTPEVICDVGAGHGLLLEEFGNLWPQASLRAIEPGQDSAQVCRDKGFEVLESTVEESEDWEESADLVTCFEVIEHVFNPKNFVASIHRLIRPGGFCLITGLGGDGFDIQTLGAHSKSIFPPHHLNFMSVKGLERLFMNMGFSRVDVTTPGKLDVDIVKNTVAEHDIDLPLPLRTLLNRGETANADFQQYLVKHKLSSHVWILARR